MADEKKEKFVVRSVRAPEEALNFLKELGEKEFSNQGEALAYLTELWNLEEAKKTTNRGKEIEDFQHLVTRINEMYVQSLALLEDTEERVRADFGSQLDVQADSIKELRQQRDELKEEIKGLNETIDMRESDLKKMEQERDEAKATQQKTDDEHSRLQQAIDNANQANELLRKEYASVKEQYSKLKGLQEKVAELEATLKQTELEKQQAVLDAKQEVLTEQRERQKAYDELMAQYRKAVDDRKASDERYAQLQTSKAEGEQTAYEKQRAQQEDIDKLQRQYDESERARQEAVTEAMNLRKELEHLKKLHDEKASQ